MIGTLHQIYKINTSSRINSFLYFLKTLPLFKTWLKNVNYSFLGLKKIIGFISIIYNFLAIPIKSLLIFLLTMYLPCIIFFEGNINLPLSTLIFFFYFLLRLINSKILEYDINKYIMIKQMGMNAKNYCLAITFPDEIIRFIGKAIIFSIFLGTSTYPLYGVLIALSMSCFSFFCEALNLFVYDRFNHLSLSNHGFLLGILYFLIVALGYALAFSSQFTIFFQILTNPIFLIVTIILGIGGAFYVYKYRDYIRVINDTCGIEKVEINKKAASEASFVDVKINDGDFTDEDLQTSKFANKEGYSYLNSIFFDRHKNIVYKPMLIKSLIVIGIFMVLFIISEFFYKELGPLLGNELYNNYTLFVMILYLLCNSERLIKSMFYNCDLSLLRYGFYKKGDALLKMFFLRLARIIYSNIIPTTVLAVGVAFTIIHYTSFGFMTIMPIIVLLYALAMFFSVHYIFMYYIFQPYTSSLEVKNPFYSFINYMVYFVSYMLLQVKAPPAMFLPIIIIFLILYTIFAIVLVYKKSPQTFRVK